MKRGMPKKAPQVIYLQACGDCDYDCGTCEEPFAPEEEVTWCEDKINNSDIKYIREDHIEAYLRDRDS